MGTRGVGSKSYRYGINIHSTNNSLFVLSFHQYMLLEGLAEIDQLESFKYVIKRGQIRQRILHGMLFECPIIFMLLFGLKVGMVWNGLG